MLTRILHTKSCIICKEVKELNQFSLHKRMRDGHLNKCKSCASSYSRQHRIDNPGYYKEYEGSRSNLPERLLQTKCAQAKYKDRHQDRINARTIVNNSIRGGKLKRLLCHICGNMGEAHHEDYTKPLDITWVCHFHHKEIHRKGGVNETTAN